MTKSIQDMIDKYAEKYGNISDTLSDRLLYIKDRYNIDPDKLDKAMYEIAQIKTKTLKFTIPLVPTPSPRPRYSFKTKHFYVSGAGEMHRYMDEFLNKNDIIVEYTIPDEMELNEFVCDVAENVGIICTRTNLSITTYQPVPFSSMSGIEIYLAELGIIRPIQNPDWDNLGKTYCDMIQGRLLLNDNIIADGYVSKFWSIKPRIDIQIEYLKQHDCKFNRSKMERSRSYRNYMEQFNINVR